MYPKNAASPPEVPIGCVVQISDGAVQTSGVTVSIRTSNDTETTAANNATVAYSTGGIVVYTPTQGETNHDWFWLTAYKSGCLPAAVLVVPTASATAGKVVLSGETHTSAVIPTVTAVTNAVVLPTGTGAGQISLSSGTVTVGTNNDKTGYTASTVIDKTGYSLTAITGLGNQTANITGNLSGSVGSVTGAVGSVTGAVGSVTGAVGSVTGNVGGNVTGSVGSIATGGIAAASFAAGAIDAAAIATDAVTEIQSGLATAASLATVAGYLDTEIATLIGYGAPPAASAIADAVWDEALSGHSGAGTAGLALSTASSGGVDPSVLADAIWDEVISTGHSTANSAGKILYDNLNAPVATVDTVVDGIATTLGAAGAGLTAVASAANLATVAGYLDTEVAAILAAVDTEVAAIKAKTDNLPASPAAVGSQMDLVNAPNATAVTAIQNGLATPTNITAGTITTVTNLTNAPTSGDLTATMKASVTAAVPTSVENADALLGRNIAGGSSTGRTVSQALYALRNKWSTTAVAGYILVYGTDDTTESWRAALTSDAAGEPITVSDPT